MPDKSWGNVEVTVSLRGDAACPHVNVGMAGLLLRVGGIGPGCSDRRYYLCDVAFGTADGALAISRGSVQSRRTMDLATILIKIRDGNENAPSENLRKAS